jgi:beta-phosphoglucomutase-like phosphatase (HAD superfamily)
LPPHGFMTSVSSDDVTRTKPDPEGYLQAAQFLQAPIHECLVLEDSATGVIAAEASGACVIAIPHLVHIAESPRVRVLTSLKELNVEKLRVLYADWQS